MVAIGQRNDAQDSQDAAEESRDAAEDAARAARIEGLVGQSESSRTTQRDLAALLAVEAFRLADTARYAVGPARDVHRQRRFSRRASHRRAVGNSGVVLPDGSSAYLSSNNARLQPYDLETGEVGAPMGSAATGPTDTGPIVASADGALLAHAVYPRLDDDVLTTVAVYETATNSERFPAIAVEGWVESVAFTGDGTKLALSVDEADMNGQLVVVDTSSGSTVATVPGVTVTGDQMTISAVTVVGTDFVVGTPDGSVRFFDTNTMELHRTLTVAPDTVTLLRPLDDATMLTAGRLGLARIGLEDGAVVWQHDEADVCANFVAIPERDTFYCGDIFGRLAERDMNTGVVIRNLDAQNGNSGALQSARGGTELVSFSLNEPVVARWRLDGSGPITRLVAPGWDVVDINETGEYVIVDRGVPTYDNQVVDTSTGETVHDLDGLLTEAWLDADTVGGAMRLDGFVELGHVDLDGGSAVSDNFNLDPIPVDAITDAGKEVPLLQYDDGEQVTIAPLDVEYAQVSARRSRSVRPSRLTISRTGHRIGVGTDSGAFLYDGDTGEQVAEIPGDDDKWRVHHRCRSAVRKHVRRRRHPVRPRIARTDPHVRRKPRLRATHPRERGRVTRRRPAAATAPSRSSTLRPALGWGHRSSSTPTNGTSSPSRSTGASSPSAAASNAKACRSGISIRRGGRRPRARSPAAISRAKSGRPTSAISRPYPRRARSFRSKPDELQARRTGIIVATSPPERRKSPTSCATSAGFSYGRMCDAPAPPRAAPGSDS